MSEAKHNSLRRFFASRLFLFVALPLAVFITFGYARSFYQGYTIQQEIKALQAEVATLERKKIESLEILNYVMSDAFVEEKARTELNLKRPGERVLVVTNRTEIDEETDSRTAASLQRIDNPIKWWYYFAHRELPH